MTEPSLADLLANEHVSRTTAIAVNYRLEQMADYVADNHDLVGPVALAVMTNLFPYYEKSRSRTQPTHPITAVVDFWTQVYGLTSCDPTLLERRMMTVDAESGPMLLQKLETALAAKDKGVVIAHTVMPLRAAIVAQQFHYRTLADLK